MELFTLSLFALGLVVCVAGSFNILYALLFGYALFFAYGLRRGHAARSLLVMSFKGIASARNILIVFGLIGALTALWRASGTIAMIITSTSTLIVPSAFLLVAFLLNCLVSLLTGTAFGTAATIGVICMSIGGVMGISPAFLGGAILSGIYFGDRCSPMSTSALLVAELTGTDIFGNIRAMLRSALWPFLLSCLLYFLLGLGSSDAAVSLSFLELFRANYAMTWFVLLPAALIILLSVFRVSVKKTMLLSILSAALVCIFLQKIPAGEVLRIVLFGYQAQAPELAAMMNGGGIVSMLRVAAIVCISSSYSGLFDGTDLLKGLKGSIGRLSQRITPFGSLLLTAIVTGMVACNQTLTIMLSHQLCKDSFADAEEMAIGLEDTAVVIAPLIPWSIAGAVPLATVAAPLSSIGLAFYLYLLPLFSLLKQKQKP